MNRVAATVAALAGAVAASVLVVGPPALAAPRAPSGSACPTNDGVTVVVDFNGLGGRDVVTGCAAGSVTSGFDALRKAGFTLTPVSNQPFLCKIDGQPSEQTCQRPAPTTAYWSYWTAARGGSWSYAQEGGGTRVPPPGSVEGWSFAQVASEDQAPPPGRTPPAPPTTTTTPTAPPTTASPGVTAPPAPVTSATTGRGVPGAPATTTTTPEVSAGAGTDDGTTSTTAPGSTTTAPPRDPDDEASVTVAEDDGSGGSAAGLALGGALVVALAAGALVTARRRRAGDPPELP